MGIKFPTPWKTLIINFPPPGDSKGVKCPGYARGGGAACWSFDLTDTLIPICRVYYTKKVSYVFMVPSTNQPGFFFSSKNSMVLTSKSVTKKIKGKKWSRKREKKKIRFVVPTPGIEPGPRRWERRILTTRPYGIDDFRRWIFGILIALPRD